MRTIYVKCKECKVECITPDDKVDGIVVKCIDSAGGVFSRYTIKGIQLDNVDQITCIPFEEKIVFKTPEDETIIPFEKWEIERL